MEWEIIDGKLVNEFQFKTQTELAQFLLKVAQFADSFHHHPDYRVFQCSKVAFALFTHDKNAITELDYELAAFISSLYKSNE
jgi:4a-hydroxytetrahydrobiopterin dehydratase